MDSVVTHVVRVSPDPAWHALDPDDALVGSAKAHIRPDERCFVRFDSPRTDAYEPLLAAVVEELERDIYVTLDEADDESRRLYENLGFAVNRREGEYLIPTDPDATRLRGVEAPAGFVFARADDADEDRLRELDDTLRQDVPGTDGWRWDEAGFREETFDSSSFDPSTYLVAIEETTGEYAGLVRVWNNPKGPRLGLIAVLAPYRRCGLARALLARVFRVLDERGKAQVSAEVDETNLASTSLLDGLGARRTGGSIELIRRHRPSATGMRGRGRHASP